MMVWTLATLVALNVAHGGTYYASLANVNVPFSISSVDPTTHIERMLNDSADLCPFQGGWQRWLTHSQSAPQTPALTPRTVETVDPEN